MTKDQKIYRAAYWIAMVILAVIFFSGAYKLLYLEQFVEDLSGFRLLPDVLIRPIAFTIPVLEILVGVSLCIPKFQKKSLKVAIGLLAIFSVVLVITLIRGLEVRCGCFGPAGGEDPVGWNHVARNVALIVLAVLALYAHKKSRTA